MTAEVHLDEGKYGQMAFHTQEDRKTRSPDGCGDRFLPSNMIRGHDSHKLGDYLGNVGLDVIQKRIERLLAEAKT
jgi:hypothetical protein